MTPSALFQGGEYIPALLGVLFVAVGAVKLVNTTARSPADTGWRSDDPDGGQTEPATARVVYTRLLGGVMIVVGIGLAFGII